MDMISLVESMAWSVPYIKLSFAYGKRRSGADMQYQVKVTIDSLTGDPYFGYPIYLKLKFGDNAWTSEYTMKEAYPSRWVNAITYTSDWNTVANKTSGTTPLTIRIYSGSGCTKDSSYSYNLGVDPAASIFGELSKGTLKSSYSIPVTKYNDNFTHTITYTCGTTNGTICTKSSSKSVSWTPPISLASENTTKNYVLIKFTIETFIGTTSLGSNSSGYITFNIPPSEVKPTCSISVSDVNGYDTTYGKSIKGISKLKITVTGTPSYGSPIASYKTVVDGTAYYGSSFETNVIENYGDIVITSIVTDNRGNTSDTKTVTKAVQNYNPPRITKLSVHRCKASNDSTEDLVNGEFVCVTYSISVTPLYTNNNSKSYTLYYKKSSESTYPTSQTISLNSDSYSVTNATYIFEAESGSSYDVKMVVTDAFNTGNKAISRSTTVSTAAAIMHFNSAGNGIGLGKVSEKENAIDCGWPIYAPMIQGDGITQFINGNSELEEVFSQMSDQTMKLVRCHPEYNMYDFFGFLCRYDANNGVLFSIPYTDDDILIKRKYSGTWEDAMLTAGFITVSRIRNGWHYRQYSDGTCDLWTELSVSNVKIKTAVGSLYRSEKITLNNYPFNLTSSSVTAEFAASNGIGALMWPASEKTTDAPPGYYLMQPISSSTGVSGVISVHVHGTYS